MNRLWQWVAILGVLAALSSGAWWYVQRECEREHRTAYQNYQDAQENGRWTPFKPRRWRDWTNTLTF